MIYAKSAFSAAAMTLLMGSASFAQGAGPIAGERVDVQGMPTTHSTPAEQAETARINNQVGADNAAIDAKAAATDAKAASDNSQYQAQQKQYQGQLQQSQARSRIIGTARQPIMDCGNGMRPNAPPIAAACGRTAT